MFCQTCDKKSNCIKICPELENYLSKNPDGYSSRHIRRKEVPYGNSEDMGQFSACKAFILKYGKTYIRKIISEKNNWE